MNAHRFAADKSPGIASFSPKATTQFGGRFSTETPFKLVAQLRAWEPQSQQKVHPQKTLASWQIGASNVFLSDAS